ncbi:hypothetical protein MNBD_NITROSPINAE02-105 [hydrothermal vent metagenome]|uniref:Uncharacterized protein n=1 Tax=hydrothermal vent metagenome TaxID=652676 RepID=A0A3B1CJU3_9ZZZZ
MSGDYYQREASPDDDNIARDLAMYMRSLTDTFAEFDHGLKRHEAFGKRLLETVGKVNSRRLDIFEILKLLTKEVGELQTGMDKTKEEITLLKSARIAPDDKEAKEPARYKSPLGATDDLLDMDTREIYQRSKKAFREIDNAIDEKARSKHNHDPEKEWSEVELDLSSLKAEFENSCSRFREGFRRQQNYYNKLMQTVDKVSDRKAKANEAIKKNRLILDQLQNGLDILRGALATLTGQEEVLGGEQKEFLSSVKSSEPATPGNDASFDGAGAGKTGDYERKLALERKLEEGEKAIKLYRFKENILKQKSDIYQAELKKFEKEISGVKLKEKRLLREYVDFLARIQNAVHVPDDIQKVLSEIRFTNEESGADSGEPIRSSRI